MTDDEIDRDVAGSHDLPGSWHPCAWCGNRHYLNDLDFTWEDEIIEVLYGLVQYLPVERQCEIRVARRYLHRLGRKACGRSRPAKYSNVAAVLGAQTLRHHRGSIGVCWR